MRREVDSDGDTVFESAQAFVYDGTDMVLVFDDPPGGSGSGSLTHRFLPDAATDAVFASEDALDGILWHLTDHQGTVCDVAQRDATSGDTSVVNHVKYSSFGTITSQTDASKTPVAAFTGMYRDPDTGLQKHGERWYDPAIGQWLSEDPIGFAGGDANLRRYVGNSPLNFIDPSGLEISPQQYLNTIAQAQAAQAATVQAYADYQVEYYRLYVLLTAQQISAQQAAAVRQRMLRIEWMVRRLRVEYENRALFISHNYTFLGWAIERENRERAMQSRPPLRTPVGERPNAAGDFEMDLAEEHRQRMRQMAGQTLDTMREMATEVGTNIATDMAVGVVTGGLGRVAGPLASRMGDNAGEWMEWWRRRRRGAPESPAPPRLRGENPRPSSGQRVNTDLAGGEVQARQLFDELTGGSYVVDPRSGHLVGPNGQRLRLGSDGRWRLDIPAHDGLRPETIHFNP